MKTLRTTIPSAKPQPDISHLESKDPEKKLPAAQAINQAPKTISGPVGNRPSNSSTLPRRVMVPRNGKGVRSRSAKGVRLSRKRHVSGPRVLNFQFSLSSESVNP